MSKIYFVTGTDTEVGKTFVTSSLLRAFRRQGLSCKAMKPIASGCDEASGQLRNGDAMALMHHASVKLEYETVNPNAFAPAIAPHIAAQESGQAITVQGLVEQTHLFMQHECDISLIEGAGGWLVPLNDKESFEDYVKALSLPVILVVSIRLGCINHALLSARAIRQAGLSLAGWVANISVPDGERVKENIDSIANWMEAPLLATIPYIHPTKSDPNMDGRIEAAAAYFSSDCLQTLLSIE